MSNLSICGRFKHCLFETDNYAIYRFENDKMDIVVLGNISDIDYDAEYELIGEFVEHRRYGMQFKVEYFKRLLPKDESELLLFLSSSYFKGVGKVLAKKIIKALNGRPLLSLLEEPKILDTIKKIKPEVKHNLLISLEAFNPETQKLYELFLKANLSIDKIHLIAKKYGGDTFDRVVKHPFMLLKDFNFFSFNQIDKLANILEIDNDNAERLCFLVAHLCMGESFKRGDSYLDYDILKNLFIKQKLSPEAFEQALDDAVEGHLIYLEKNKIFHHSQYLAEQNIVEKLLNLNNLNTINEIGLNDAIAVLENNQGLIYSLEQKKAINNFFNHHFSIIVGGPGTGKTTLINALIKLSNQYNPLDSIVVLAPTGLAAKRISELCGVKSSTIHSLLKWNKDSNTFVHYENNPLFIDTVIIDESSMVDTYLFSKFLSGVSGLKKLCLIGDYHQLPSVAPGDLLHDLITSNIFNVTELKCNYRQENGNDIIDLAYDILNEQVDFNKYQNDVILIEDDELKLKEFIVDSINSYLEQGYDFYDIQIMAPMYKGVMGIDNLNVYLQKVFNPPTQDKKEYKFYSRIYRIGDKILQTKNQNDQNVYNGDIGELIDIVYDESVDKKYPQLVVDFNGNIVFYTHKEFDNITHAYAITVHKAQGSEYKITYIISVYEHRFMLQKELIYTAISRTRYKCFIMGDGALFINSSKAKSKKRLTGIVDRIKNITKE